MKCIAIITWDDGVWLAKATTSDGNSIGLTLESGSFDALIERVKVAILEMLEENFGHVRQ